jgi:hypothetical protein
VPPESWSDVLLSRSDALAVAAAAAAAAAAADAATAAAAAAFCCAKSVFGEPCCAEITGAGRVVSSKPSLRREELSPLPGATGGAGDCVWPALFPAATAPLCLVPLLIWNTLRMVPPPLLRVDMDEPEAGATAAAEAGCSTPLPALAADPDAAAAAASGDVP